VRRHLAAAGGGILFRPDARQEHLERCHSELQAQRAIAVIGEEPVVAGFEREARGDEHRFVSGAADLEENLALMLQLDFFVIDPARPQHAAIHLKKRGFVEPVKDYTARLTRGARLTRWRGYGLRRGAASVDDGCFHWRDEL